MKIKSLLYSLLIIILLLLNFSVFIAPYLAYSGNSFATSIYDFYIPLCHQYIYRSFCLFSDNSNSLWIDECIPHNEEKSILIETRFTSWPNTYDGVFHYNKDQVGLNRADYLIEGNIKGYKFPICARDTGFYLGLLIGVVFYYLLFSDFDIFPFSYFLMSAVPMAVDGFFQFFLNYEATVYFRFFTGIASGVLLGILIVGNFISKIEK